MENTEFFTFFTIFAPIWFWIVLAIVTGIAANQRGRDGVIFFLANLFLMEGFALICVLVMDKNQKELDHRSIENETMKECPQCIELVKSNASVCQYCGYEYGTQEPQ